MDQYKKHSEAVIWWEPNRSLGKKVKRSGNKRARMSLKVELRNLIIENFHDKEQYWDDDDCGTLNCEGCYRDWLKDNHYDDE